MTDSVQCNKYLSARWLQDHLSQIFSSFKCTLVCPFWLSIKQLIMHTAAFFLTAPQVSEIQPMMFYTLPTPMSFSLSCNSAFSTFIKDIAKQEFCTSNPANLLTISLTLPDQFPLLFAAGEGNHLQFCVRALVIVRTTSIITRKG